MARPRHLLGVTVLLVAGCSGSTTAQPEAASPVEPSTTASTGVDAATTSVPPDAATTTSQGPTSAGATADSPSSPAPLTPYTTGGVTESGSVDGDVDNAWISRRLMTADRIEVQWNAPEGAAEYQIHRVLNADDTEPDGSAMTADNLIHSGEDTGVFLDEEVSEGARYWYGVRGLDADGAVLSIGWHRAAAVTDEEPPSPVDLSMDIEDGAVLLTWNIPEENYELHGYRVLRAVGNEEPEVVSTTWRIDQTSFIDSEPPKARVTYFVEAFDFHWNESSPAELAVDLS